MSKKRWGWGVTPLVTLPSLHRQVSDESARSSVQSVQEISLATAVSRYSVKYIVQVQYRYRVQSVQEISLATVVSLLVSPLGYSNRVDCKL